MKIIYSFFIGIALAVCSQAQSLPAVDSTTKKIAYTDVVTVDGATQAVLFKRAHGLNISGSGVLTDKPADGYYSYKGQFKVSYHAPQPGLMHAGIVTYTVVLACKDGRYKYVITDFVHTSEKGNGGALEKSVPECNKYVLSMQGWGDIKKLTAAEMEKLVANIKVGMGNQNDKPVNVGTDW
ncbi:hypothetical protein [Cytophaga hutchinsonii]|jgi:hypothetical protein|uniref:DUF4468 domain-containing protein n=1 Tax=Cytophaga hutchinsonii (strain ATCC 33406 / DSM 1761 / CIP 103989 / NBRC 15051 / NCIMB 9469 / D465) TaxID=269798 RepID=A0A6N4STH7_CYTH3|nr:hypothetical protein [Cytophaga hutchinsonii]ABG59602.1 hypothetical protein CHU_2344 [Cytophaga hutchinsonii ATCC 33406]SFX67386.1 hypothetical protein SAMN04487930_107186 [Cytophaga hutchinsonii ATCC 33406]